MYTIPQLLDKGQRQTGDKTTEGRQLLLDGINEGLAKFRAALNVQITQERRKFTISAGQRRLQAPENTIKVAKLFVPNGNELRELTRVDDDNQWQRTSSNQTTTGSYPTHFRVLMQDIIEIYPAPGANLLNCEILYEAYGSELGEDDYKAGSVAIAEDSTTLVGTGTTFTPDMVGRYFKLTTGGHKQAYKIIGFTDATHLELENKWMYITVSGKADYVVGEMANIPQEFHMNMLDRGYYRYYLRRKNMSLAKEHKQEFIDSVALARSTYNNPDASNVINSSFRSRNQSPANTLFGKPGAA